MPSSESNAHGVVFITGAAGGIGAACVQRFLQEGYRVAGSDIAGVQLEQHLAHYHPDFFMSHKVDVTNPLSINQAINETAQRWGNITAAVNVAGVGGAPVRIDQLDPGDFSRVVAVNLIGVFHSIQAESRSMISGSGGSIVNITSVLGTTAVPHASAYIAAKHGLEGLTKAAALDLAGATPLVRVNSIAPGFISTPLLTERRSEEERESIARAHPLSRLGTSEEVAHLALYLCGHDAEFITGTSIAVDGGFLAGRKL